MDERADITDQPGTTPPPSPPRGDPGRDIAALVFSILSFVALPVVGALVAIALVGRSWKGSNSPTGNAARIIATVNLYLCAFVVGVLGILAGKEALDDRAEESFKETAQAIGGLGGTESGLLCRWSGQPFDFEEWVTSRATPAQRRRVLTLVGDKYLDEFFEDASEAEVREACEMFGGFLVPE